jgi:anaerobic selenocysteine-containing dehydrogenase
VADLDNARCIVMWGANPPHAHPTMTHHVTRARRAGATLVVVDPRMSAMARRADFHVAPRPGTDGALAWGLVHQFISTGGYAKDFVAQHTLGFAQVAAYAEAFTPEAVEEETGVAAETIRIVARTMAAAAPQVSVYAGNGLEHHENGANNIRAIAMIDGLLGSVDVEGGNRLAESPALNDLTLYEERPLLHLGPLGADRFPVLYEMRRECHTMTAMRAILEGEPYPLRAMIMTGANPALTNPNSTRVRRALEALDLLVVRDLFMTETAELADYVLPAASFLERTELHTHAKYQLLTLTQRVLSWPDVQGEYEFWRDLARRLGMGDLFPWEDEAALNRWLLEPTGMDLDELVSHPEGLQYAPLRSRRWEGDLLPTPSGKVEFTSQYLKDLGYDEIPVYRSPVYLRSPDPEYPFVLMTGARKLLYLHSRFRNIPRFRAAAPGPEVEMHPTDAADLGVADGDLVRIVSHIGAVEIAVRVTEADALLPGTLQITHGWKDANVNLVTHDDRSDPVSGFPLMKSVQVRVERAS